MGNQGSAVPDEPVSGVAQRNLQHFDHSFKADIHTTSGPLFVHVFDECKFQKRPVSLICKAASFEVIEEIGITTKKQVEIDYADITGLAWDHANSEAKVSLNKHNEESFIILILGNSVEFEGEMKLRLSAAASSNSKIKIPSPMYVGMFAGATKPKPFQRKRPNLSHLPSGKLPTLHDMRNLALDLHRGSYRPCPQGESRRVEIALQHIYEGHNTFHLLTVRGASHIANRSRPDSTLVICDEAIVLKPRGNLTDEKVEIPFDDISDWNAVDNDTRRLNESGIEVQLTTGENVFFGVTYVRDVKHTLEYFWNSYKVSNGASDSIKLGSTHGRPIVSVHTLSGEIPPGERPTGQSEVVDQDGIVVRPGGKIAPRRSSISAGVIASKEPKNVPPENRDVKKHWHKVVLHQGWLLKQGGVGVGNSKSWIKRYFVLYKTSQGHFLVYYSDFTECPMYTSEKHHRNIVDLAKATFIRPGSNKQDNPDTPPYSFDIVTTEREWTLCAESQENVQKWLKLLTRAVDEDVAILPDEELIFKVKPKLDPLQVLPATDYSTTLKISANGVSVTAPDPNSKDSSEKEHYFWVYTDFYKWSLMCPDGKFALLVNVFADSSFSRRYEYVFRTKEAHRLATAIEYFIEKFMSVMHIRMETMEGGFDQVPEPPTETHNQGANKLGSGLHQTAPEDAHTSNYGEEIDLLGLDVESSPMKSNPSTNTNDVFGRNPFESEASHHPPPPPSSSHIENDLLGVGPSQSVASTNGFGDDPFGGDPFGNFSISSNANISKVAPPLSPAQVEQHNKWYLSVLSSGQGPIYNDGSLQIIAKFEVRGSQARLTFAFQNNSQGSMSDLVVEIQDSVGLLRFEASPLASTIPGLGNATQTIMIECMKPASPGPQLSVSYNDQLHGKRANAIKLPLMVTTFNEPLSLLGDDFGVRWQALTNQGQESQQIFKPSFVIVPAQIQQYLVSILKFSKIEGIPGSSEYILYGAASLKTGAKTPTGEKISVGCLTKIEINVQANALRVTLRTIHPSATTAIMETVKNLFS